MYNLHEACRLKRAALIKGKLDKVGLIIFQIEEVIEIIARGRIHETSNDPLAV